MRVLHPLDQASTYAAVLDALPIAAYMAAPDGTLTYLSHGWQRYSGNDADELLSRGFGSIIHPDDRPLARHTWAESSASGAAYRDEYRVRFGDGTYRWVLSQAEPMRGDHGELLGWFGTLTDIDDLKRAEGALADSEATYRALTGAIPGVTWAASPQGELTFVGERWISLHGRPREGALGESWLESVFPGDRERVLARWAESLASGEEYDIQFRVRIFDGTYRWFLVRALPVRDANGTIVRWFGVNVDIDEQRKADERLRTLAETGAAIFASLDFEQTLRNIAQASIRAFATYCVVDTINTDNEVRNVAAIHADPTLNAVLESAVPKRALLPDHPSTRALQQGVSTFVAAIPPTWVADTGMDASGEREFRALSPRSLICVPMRTPSTGAVVGAVTFVIAGDDTRGAYTNDDVRFAEEIAMRAGLAFDHAVAYERERRIAVTFQDASLPAHLPTLPNLRLSADYRPGSNEATIGGDWYDAFLLDDGRIALTMGDVIGNGLGAAVTMSRVRQAMRAVASVAPDPSAMLNVADRTIRDESDSTYATALAGVLDPVTRTLLFASAGHPGPWIRRRDGSVDEFAVPGMMLGLRTPGEAETVSIPMETGASLVFFTDGLIEGTRNIDHGYERLRGAMSDIHTFTGDPAAALIERILAGEPARDDIAVLVCGLDNADEANG
jgi:PAS domain S-box-containing protein